MRILVAAVGRARQGPERDLFEHYARRISPPLLLKEVEEKRPVPPARMKKRQGEMLLAAVPAGAAVVALDAKGRALDSAALAGRTADWRDGGIRDLALLVGGPEGLDEAVLGRAGLVLSLGPMTWPHMLVRGMLAEQIYRAQCILAGHPYHRE